MTQRTTPAAEAEQKTATALANLDPNDPKALMTLLLQTLQQNAALARGQVEATAINRKLLEIELARKEAQEKKDAEALATLERQRKEALASLNTRLELKEAQIENCPHTDQKGGSTIWPISNSPDGQLRGICSHCPIFIEPAHYEEDAYGNRTLIPEHPLYKLVKERDRAIYGGFVQLTSY